jgi:hypothetical protein
MPTMSQANITATTPMGATLVVGGATFRVWAPAASAVFLKGALGGRSDWSQASSGNLLAKGADGTWTGFMPGVAEGDLYKYWVVGPPGGSAGFKRGRGREDRVPGRARLQRSSTIARDRVRRKAEHGLRRRRLLLAGSPVFGLLQSGDRDLARGARHSAFVHGAGVSRGQRKTSCACGGSSRPCGVAAPTCSTCTTRTGSSRRADRCTTSRRRRRSRSRLGRSWCSVGRAIAEVAREERRLGLVWRGMDELVTVALYPDVSQAELAKERLELEGIRSFTIDAQAAGVMPFLANTSGRVRVQVEPKDLERAKEILGI